MSDDDRASDSVARVRARVEGLMSEEFGYPAVVQVVPADAVACGPLVDLLLLSTVRRLVTVARRIDLHAGGLSVESVAAIDDTTLVHATGAFRRYRPFAKTQ